MKLDAIANGLGSQSMLLLLLASRGVLSATVSITADTAAEEDRVWNTGERTSAGAYFEQVVKPLCAGWGMDAVLVRAVDENKEMLPPLLEHVQQCIAEGKLTGLKIPLFGSEGGRLKQLCTDKWKIRAIRQEARRRGATKLRTAQGLHAGEKRRIRGQYIADVQRFAIYQDVVVRRKVVTLLQWCEHYYPLVDLNIFRDEARQQLEAAGIPYLVTSECDMCPHQDLARWERHTPEKLVQIAGIEASMNGEFFFTDERIPLLQALKVKRARQDANPKIDFGESDFGCKNGYCGI